MDEAFKAAVLDYLGETPVWAGGHWQLSEEAKARARALADRTSGAVSTVYRWAIGVACPHSIMQEVIIREISELVKE